jgi:hypothetical protein
MASGLSGSPGTSYELWPRATNSYDVRCQGLREGIVFGASLATMSW